MGFLGWGLLGFGVSTHQFLKHWLRSGSSASRTAASLVERSLRALNRPIVEQLGDGEGGDAGGDGGRLKQHKEN